jgi:hypothetical protein
MQQSLFEPNVERRAEARLQITAAIWLSAAAFLLALTALTLVLLR